MHFILATTLVMTNAMCLISADEEIDPILNEESWDSGTQVDPGHGFGADGVDGYIESWVFVSVPDAGTYSLREVLEEGSVGWAAFVAYGEPIESYEPVSIFTHSVNGNNSGIEVLMPIVGCDGDFNDDGVIDIHDILIFADWFLHSNLQADLNGDGVIDIDDQFSFFELVLDECG